MRHLAYSLAASVAFIVNANAQVRISEFMYAGFDGEFIELTNVGGTAVDMTGWSLDDESRIVGSLDLSPAGMLFPGESLIVTESPALDFEANWGLSGVTIIGGNTTARLGRNDYIEVYNAVGFPVDRLSYGDQQFTGTIRPREVSANICAEGLGSADFYRWTAAAVGDAWSSRVSLGGDIGSPGSYINFPCPSLGNVYCTSPANSTGTAAHLTIQGSPSVLFNIVSLKCEDLPLNTIGLFVASPTPDLVLNPGGSAGTLCLGSGATRLIASAQSSLSNGEMNFSIDLDGVTPGGVPNITPMETWHFQCWFRDSSMGTATSNFSDARVIQFL